MHLGDIIHDVADVGGSLLGGALGEGLETGADGYQTYEDIHHHQYGAALDDGAETVLHGVLTGIDIADGDLV